MTNRFKASLLAAVAAIALASSVSTIGQAAAQKVVKVSQKIAPQDLPGPTLAARVDGVNAATAVRPLHISVLDVSVSVRGDLAETVVMATFDNPGRELLEGRFVLNMARGAVVTGYALDIGGTLVDGVLETRYKAAEAYQNRVVRRIDPGLAEVDYSDRFETRIYPVPPNGSRTIRLSMVNQFDPKDGYILPLTVDDHVGRFSLKIRGDVKVVSLPHGLKSGSEFELENVALKGAVRLTASAERAPVIMSRHPGAETFFDIVGPAPRGGVSRNKPLHIFWDRSVSRTDDALKDESQLAEDFAVKHGLRRAMLTLFDSGRAETKEVNADRIFETLRDVHYRGATSYASLSGIDVLPDADCLMFTDGRVTIDDRAGFVLPCAVTSITSGPEHDMAWLGDLAQRTGGAVHTLTKTNAKDILRLLDRPNASMLSITDGEGRPIDVAILPSSAGSFHIVGPAPDDGAVLVRMEGEAEPRRLDTATPRLVTFSGPGALWARHRLGVIASDSKPDDLAAMARRYNIATPDASFVVLETPADYVQNNIVPPDSYPKALRANYDSLREAADRTASYRRDTRMNEVVALWTKQKAWWEREFKGPQAAASPPGPNITPDLSPRAVAAASPPPPPPPTSPPPAAPTSSSERVIVTGSRLAGAVEDAAVAVTAVTGETSDVRERLGGAGDSDEQDSGAGQSRLGSIEVTEWSADRPYLDRLDKAGANWEQAIDAEMKENGALPLFWFDLGEWHWRAGRREEARRAVEAALDLPSRDNQTLAIVAARLLRYGSHDRAIWLLERLMEREADRPQPKRTLALALLERTKVDATPDLVKADLARAIELLAKAATDVYTQAGRGIETVSLMEANAALARLKRMGGSSEALDPRLIALLDADLRVVMEWNTPRTDLDLWVRDPKGFDTGYSSPLAPWGGKLSGDITDGYGPEEYVIHRAPQGIYEIRAKTYASDRSNPNGPSTLTVRLIRNFGRPDQSEQLLDLEMDAQARDKVQIGKITIE